MKGAETGKGEDVPASSHLTLQKADARWLIVVGCWSVKMKHHGLIGTSAASKPCLKRLSIGF